eukprot:TRINITY_DN14037_c0_g1_i3.p1 TRINITY_DN14037_c0_g1~~TRINITY_DN14037_c0_g1_i3.p1  ORF type:complete len:283 (+),score=20.50 TRINITY_DN14037_c0_g1_i3:83-931(+)
MDVTLIVDLVTAILLYGACVLWALIIRNRLDETRSLDPWSMVVTVPRAMLISAFLLGSASIFRYGYNSLDVSDRTYTTYGQALRVCFDLFQDVTQIFLYISLSSLCYSNFFIARSSVDLMVPDEEQARIRALLVGITVLNIISCGVTNTLRPLFNNRSWAVIFISTGFLDLSFLVVFAWFYFVVLFRYISDLKCVSVNTAKQHLRRYAWFLVALTFVCFAGMTVQAILIYAYSATFYSNTYYSPLALSLDLPALVELVANYVCIFFFWRPAPNAEKPAPASA